MKPASEAAPADGVFLPPEYESRRRLQRARDAIEKGEFSEAVQRLGVLLESTEDYFFRPDPAQAQYRSLKTEAGRLISRLPARGLEAFELQYGGRARQMLNVAIGLHQIDGVEEVSRRFFYTRAGGEATLLLARHYFDNGLPLAAALSLERLRSVPSLSAPLEPMLSVLLATCWLKTDMTARAQQTLLGLKRSSAADTVLIAGEQVQLFEDAADSLAWLRRHFGGTGGLPSAQLAGWPMFRGDTSRNASSQGGRPLLNHRWRQRVAEYEDARQLRDLKQVYLDQDVAAMPGLHPLAVGDVVLMRTPRSLLAVDFASGKRVWEARPSPNMYFDQLLARGRMQRPVSTTNSMTAALEQRVWEDATYGTFSSDGELVFTVEDWGLDDDGPMAVFLTSGQRSPITLGGRVNRLTARELRTQGKLKWEVGGAGGGGDFGTPEAKLAGAYLLGPPLPLLGRLYSLAEMKGQEIRLVVLSARDGKLEWSQQLAMAEEATEQQPLHRTLGTTPSFADGILVCPTSVGAVVAVDVGTRALLWGFQYDKNPQFDRYGAFRPGIDNGPLETRTDERWADGTATIAAGRVIVTPPESDQLYCLHLVDGRLQWKMDRGSNLYVGCVHRGKVFLVAHHDVSMWNIDDGKAAWKEPLPLPSGAMPSGRGFHAGNYYYLPLTSGEVVQIDLERGVIASRSKSRHDDIPGNLICHNGQIVSQSVEYLDAYYQLDTLKAEVQQTLAARPNDAQALARLGEIKLDETNVSEAIAAFRRSFELEPDDHTRRLLIDSVLEGLRVDFATNQQAGRELAPLIEKHHQNAYLRLVASGLQELGQLPAAFEAYLKLADQPIDSAELDSIDDSLEVRRDRWLQAKLASLRSAADAELRGRIDKEVQARLEKAQTAQTADALRQFLNLFDSHELAKLAREELLKKLTGGETLLERQMLLARIEQAGDPEQSRAATARLATLFVQAARPDLAALYYRKLKAQWPDVVCLNGKTGQNLVDDLPAKSPVRVLLTPSKAWPQGQVAARTEISRTSLTPARTRPVELEIRGTCGPLFENVSLSLDPMQHVLIGRDDLGAERFRFAVSQQVARRSYAYGFSGQNVGTPNHARVSGSLMLLSMGNQLLALDTLRTGEDGSGRILWSQEMTEPTAGSTSAIQALPINVPWGLPRQVPTDAYHRPIGTTGPITSSGVVFQRFREVVCTEPLSGDTLWTRKNVSPGSDLFGDDELLFIAPPDGDESLVVRAVDGAMLGRRKLPHAEHRMALLGRQVLAWRDNDGHCELSLVDPWSSQTKWTHRFALQSKVWLVEQAAVAVMEESGRFALVSIPDGTTIIQEDLAPEPYLKDIFALRSGDQYLLITNVGSRSSDGMRTAPDGLNNPLIDGKIYAFSATTGKKMWRAPAHVSRYGLWLGQPSDLPVLVLVRQRHGGWRAGRMPEPSTSLLCIDKRSGRRAYEGDVLPSAITNFELLGEPAQSRVSVLFPGKTLVLNFTDRPVTHDSSTVTEVFGAVLRAIGGGIKDVAPAIPPETDDD